MKNHQIIPSCISNLAREVSSKKYFLSMLFLIFSIPFISKGQSIDTLAWDGSLYLKIRNSDTIVIPTYDTNMNIATLPLEVQPLVALYSISSIEKAFPAVVNDATIDRIYKVKFSQFDKISLLVRDLIAINYVEYAEKIPIDKIFCTNEYNNWIPLNTPQNYHLNLVNACNAWTISTGNANVRVAILDNEFDVTHPEIAGKIATLPVACQSAWDVADNDNTLLSLVANTFDHGTHVAGIAGGQTNGGGVGGIASLGFNVSLMLGKVSGDNIGGFPNNGSFITHGYEGIVWAVNNCADVINNSWGGSLYSITHQNIINWAANQGVVIVAAAGNDNNSIQHYPAAYTNVFAVANTDQNDVKYLAPQGGSCFGSWVDISAPGTSIFSPVTSAYYPANSYGYKTGTSMAAPMVSALCGLILSVNPTYNAQNVLNCITSTADNIYNIAANAPYIGQLGAGRINAFAALQCAQLPGNSVFFTASTTALCEGGSVTFTDASITANPITAWLWNFGDGFTSTQQNPTHLYNNSGVYNVTLTVTTINGTFSWTAANFLNVIGISMVTPAVNVPLCRGQEVQFNINFTGIPPYSIDYGINAAGPFTYAPIQSPGQIYFNTAAAGNTTLHVYSITSNGLTCPVNTDIVVNTIECCVNNIIVNGDFDNGITGFTTQQTLVGAFNFLCPGLYDVDVYSGPLAVPPGNAGYPTNKGNALFVDCRANKSCPGFGFQNTCGVNFPVNTELPCSNGIFPNQSSTLWEQANVNLNTSYSYILSFYTSEGNILLNTVQPIKLRVRLLLQGSPLYSSIVEIPYTTNRSWQQFAFNIDQNLLGAPNNILNCTFQIEQFENFQWNNFDFMIDEIHLYRYIPLTLSTNIPGNNLAGGLNSPAIITATPAGFANYAWQGPPPMGNPVANTLTNVTVAGIYTCTVTDANGCSRTSTIEIFDLCNPANLPPNALLLTPANNITNSSTLIGFNLGVPVITTNNIIFISGTFTIDQSISFINCPNIFLDANARIDLAPGATLNIDNCKLQAVCNTMWDRIYAQSATNQIIITNSIIRDMRGGVLLYNDAKINAVRNQFIDNYASMTIANTSVNYNMAWGKCVVLTNTFTSTGNNLLIPHNTQSKSEFGIILGSCKEVEIGFLPSASFMNIFQRLYNGIRIFPGSFYNLENYKLYSNRYIDIRDDIPANVPSADLYRMNNIYTNHRGAGVFSAPAFTTPSPITLTNYHKVSIMASGGPHGAAEFNNCDKAVSVTKMSADVKNYMVRNSFCGYMFTQADVQNFDIEANTIDGTLIGIQFVSNTAKTLVHKNFIKLRPLGIGFFFINFARIPIGIDVKNYNNPIDYFNISENNINIPGIYATGIRLANTGKFMYVQNNTISMTTTSTVSDNCGFGCRTELSGIHITNGKESKLLCNNISGIASLAAYNARPAQGIKFNANQRLFVKNNNINNTRYGFLAWSDNGTIVDRISCNTFDHHQFGWLLRHLGTEGTFGAQIGNSANYGDMMNVFNGTGYWNNYRVFRMTSAPFFGTIFTTQLTPIQSSSTIGVNGAYSVGVPIGTNLPCVGACGTTGGGGPIFPGIAPETNDWIIQQMLDVIADSVNYPEYPIVAEWINQLQQYATLSDDGNLLNVNDIVDSFYAFMQNANISSIDETNESIFALLTDSLALADSLAYSNLLAEAIALNSDIMSNQEYEENERIVNDMYFKILQYGMLGLSVEELSTLEALAKQCPYIGGTAVYKARSLWSNVEPANEYDDMALCNASGVYKNGTGLFDEENKWLDNLEGNEENPYIKLAEGQIKIFPNPSEGQININYNILPNDQAQLKIVDILGREVMSVDLASDANRLSLQVPFTSTGIFVYLYIVNGTQKETGKILFEK